MANNRLYLRCVCGETVYLAKYYPSTGWFMTDQRRAALVGELGDWFDAHDAHHVSHDPMYGRSITLSYEVEPVTGDHPGT